jgi:arsenate reductase
MTLRVEILVTPGCPHAQMALEGISEVLSRLAPGVGPEVRSVRDRAEALSLDFPGSPTILVNGEDLEGPGRREPAFACRRYGTDGAPPVWMIEAAVLRALGPRHVLFLCVANSARSQMAEGLARAMAPDGVRISSAGSEPTRVRPQAVAVLEEVGIDIRSQASKGVDEVEADVDTVITLCAEEVCPVWLGGARRLHWGLPDPAGVDGSDEEKLLAFREVRDELKTRLAVLFR